MTYTDCVKEYISDVGVGEPILLSDISLYLMKKCSVEYDKAKLATSVAINRILNYAHNTDLRMFQKGIYYRALNTSFGESGINIGKLINRKYIDDYNGYDTGAYLFYELGLSTQLPNKRIIATNKAADCIRYDKVLDVYTCPPKTVITKRNIKYLMVLDVLDQFDKYPVDVEHPQLILFEFIKRNDLDYNYLLFLVSNYYSRKTLFRLTDMATEVELYYGITQR